MSDHGGGKRGGLLDPHQMALATVRTPANLSHRTSGSKILKSKIGCKKLRKSHRARALRGKPGRSQRRESVDKARREQGEPLPSKGRRAPPPPPSQSTQNRHGKRAGLHRDASRLESPRPTQHAVRAGNAHPSRGVECTGKIGGPGSWRTRKATDKIPPT